MGGVRVWISAAEAVSQFPGPPLEDPPTSPPHLLTGAQLGGARWDDWRTRCPVFGQRSVAADVPACWRGGCSGGARQAHEVRRLCGRRDTKRSDWRGGRAGPITSTHSMHSAARASGMAGDRSDDLAGVQRTKRSGVNGTSVSSSSGPRSRTREGNKARDPRARERAAVVNSAGAAGLTWLFGIAMKAQP